MQVLIIADDVKVRTAVADAATADGVIVDFAESLDQELGVRMLTTTDARHIGGAAGSTGVVETGEVANLAPRRDGNNVQLDRELLSMTRAAGDFTAAQTVLAAKFRLVRYAINEGR